MENIAIVLGLLLLGLLLTKFFKSNQSSLVFQLLDAKLEEKRQSYAIDLSKFREGLKEDLDSRFNRFETKIDQKLSQMEKKVEDKLEDGLRKSATTFEQVLMRLAKIDEAQKQMDKIGDSMISLKEILASNKSRGTLGEVQLYQIVYSVFGDNPRAYQKQYKFDSGQIVDLALFMPEPTGLLCVDSKFPLSNFKKIHDEALSTDERALALKQFKKDVKKHIDDIADKYIKPPHTSEQAIMFIPAEAIFSEIHAFHDDLLNYSYQKKVWLASPTTFMAMLTTAQVVINNIERNKYAHIIQSELVQLSRDFERYKSRWSKLSTHFETVHRDFKDIHITTDKISSKFDRINQAQFSESPNLKLKSS